MGKLIDDLLAFSRMSRVSLNKRPVNLATLVQEILRPVQRDLKDRQVEWVIGTCHRWKLIWTCSARCC